MCIVKVTKSVIRQFSDNGILKKRPTVGNVVLTELEETGEVLTMFFNQQKPISINLAFPARRSLHVPGDSKRRMVEFAVETSHNRFRTWMQQLVYVL